MIHTGRAKRGFTILESLIMLGLLVAFSVVVAGVYRKGITTSADAQDPAWLSKGGDESMKTVNSIPADKMAPGALREQPGLGGDATETPDKQDNVSKPE